MISQLETEYAGFWRRAAAYLLDGLLVGLGTGLARATVFWSGSWTVAMVAWIVWFLAAFLYRPVCHAAWGMTLGKFVSGVRVTRVDGVSLGFVRALVREVLDVPQVLYGLVVYIILLSFEPAAVNYASYQEAMNRIYFAQCGILTWSLKIGGLVIFLVQVAMVIMHPQHRVLHDLIAGTVVMKEHPKWRKGKPIVVVAKAEDMECLECGKTMRPGVAVCPACGWSYEGSEPTG